MYRTADENELDGQRYLEFQLSWFGKKYDLENDFSIIDKDNAKKELIDFLESYVNKGAKLFKNEEKENGDQEKFTKLYDNVYSRQDPNRNRIYSISKINKLLENQGLGYKVESDRTTEDSKNKKTYWKVIRCIWLPLNQKTK